MNLSIQETDSVPLFCIRIQIISTMASSGLAPGLIEDQFPSEGIVPPQDFLWLTNPPKKKRFFWNEKQI